MIRIQRSLLLLGMLWTYAYADLSIVKSPPEMLISPGNPLNAQAQNIPLNVLLVSMYPGYAIKCNQVNNMLISFDGTRNDAVSVLQTFAEKYHLRFDINPEQQCIEVSPASNISYQSYLEGWQHLQQQVSPANAKGITQTNRVNKHLLWPEKTSSREKQKTLALALSPFIDKALQEQIKSVYEKHLLGADFKRFLVEAALVFYQNDQTNKLAIAQSVDTAKILSQQAVYYAHQGDQLHATILRWAKDAKIIIDIASIPAGTLASDVIYAGSLITNDLPNNVLYQLLSDTLQWRKA